MYDKLGMVRVEHQLPCLGDKLPVHKACALRQHTPPMQGLGQIVGEGPVISGAGKGMDVRKHQVLAQGHPGMELFPTLCGSG